jgi:hypothetical protein
MAQSRFIQTCDNAKECAGMLKHNKDMMPYIERAIAYKLDEISKKLDGGGHLKKSEKDKCFEDGGSWVGLTNDMENGNCVHAL